MKRFLSTSIVVIIGLAILIATFPRVLPQKDIFQAIRLEDDEFVSRWIKNGNARQEQKVSPLSNTPLHESVRYGRLKYIKWFLDSGADPYASDGDCLTPVALLAGSGDASRSYIESACNLFQSANVDLCRPCAPSGKFLLHFAATCRSPAYIDYLLSLGCDVDCVDSSGRTPLHYCLESRSFSAAYPTASALINAGARYDIGDMNGDTPLDLARRNGIEDQVKSLIDQISRRDGKVK